MLSGAFEGGAVQIIYAHFLNLSFQVWFVRIALLFKLKSFSSAEAELNAFGDFDNPDLYYQYYPSIHMGLKGESHCFQV